LKLTIVGGGGFRVPQVHAALLARRDALALTEVVLHDVDSARLERIGVVLSEQTREHGAALPLRATTDPEDAVEGADFVFAAIRPGGLEGRAIDESVALARGLLGQETTGPGGICFALRTIPAMLALAELVARRAPHAWLVNFTNPAGMVTEAVQQVLGDRAVGICDSPSGLCRRVAAALGRTPGELWFDYFGLNHLGWLKGVRGAEGELLPQLLADDEALAGFEEGALFGADWLRSLGMIPNEYLYYFYFAAETVAAIRGGRARGAFLLEQQAGFYAGNGSDALAAWRAARSERERSYMAEARSAAGIATEHAQDPAGGYEDEALAVVEAIALGSGSVMICNTANRCALPFLDERAVVEVPAAIGVAGPQPIAVGPVPDHARALIESVKAAERATIEAALSGSPALAVKALALHPLVPSVNAARELFGAYRAQLPELQERFA
jgi:6-phospho-beta-glucosidase